MYGTRILTQQILGYNCQWIVNSLTVSPRGPSLPHRPNAWQKCGDPTGVWQHSGHYCCKYSKTTPQHMCTQIWIGDLCVSFCSMLTMCVYSADKISAVNAHSLTLDSSNWWWTLRARFVWGSVSFTLLACSLSLSHIKACVWDLVCIRGDRESADV